MSAAVRTIQTPYLSLNRSSTPMPYSVGKPTLNCCGGSLSTLGNMKRPVAASAAADAAGNAPHASPIQARRVRRGDVSSAARPPATAGLAAAGIATAALAWAPPIDAAVVVLPARSGSGAAGGLGADGFAAGAAAGAGAGAVPSGFVSSAISSIPSPSRLRAQPAEPSYCDPAG